MPPTHHPHSLFHHPALSGLPVTSSPLPHSAIPPPLSLPAASSALAELTSERSRSRSPPLRSPSPPRHHTPRSPSPRSPLLDPSDLGRPATPVSPPRAFYPPGLAAAVRPSSRPPSMSPPLVKPNLASLPISTSFIHNPPVSD